MTETLAFKKAKIEGKATRVMSLSMLAAYFNTSRNTVLGWKRDGCPIEKAATKKGESDQFDIADVIAWRIAAERRDAVLGVAKASPVPGGADDGLETEEQAKARRARAMADIAEVDAAERIGAVALIADVEAIVVERFSRAVAVIQNMPPALAAKTCKMTDPSEIRAWADKYVRRAMRPLAWGEPVEDEDEIEIDPELDQDDADMEDGDAAETATA
jgi:phage terminase Nu1 subunit (DNA packaging protein)